MTNTKTDPTNLHRRIDQIRRPTQLEYQAAARVVSRERDAGALLEMLGLQEVAG